MTRILSPKWPALLALLALGGCAWGFQESNGEVPEMHKNLSRTMDIQTSVIQGDLDKAQAAAQWLISRQARNAFPPSAKVYEDEILESASTISTATELEAVAIQASLIAASCGSCHQAIGGGPKFVVGTKSPRGGSQGEQMLRHLWAADRMWEGLVGPSDEAWKAGARAMAETRPALARAFRNSAMVQVAEGLLGEVNGLAEEALSASDLAGRADVYGRLLHTCNRCHSPSGVYVTK